MEGFVLSKKLETRETKEVLDHHTEALLELYDKSKPSIWTNIRRSQNEKLSITSTVYALC